ncbi:calmodulin-binding protein 60 A isoform X2 [Cucumis sativus]|uniref:calmodulin-binding protein 60 A isoform X2 n=1 Tax=Cucumis sativus TaxID=3659 RepID=UPI0012F4C7F9|nr:calmodulin-binding protein 60 A isoform X2 [Cucumis sativus]
MSIWTESGEDEARAKEIVDALIKEKRAEWESEFRQLLMNEFDGIANAQLKPLPSTPRKYKLRFWYEIMDTMYHGDKIKSSTDNQVLKFEICDAYSNTVITNEPISFAMVELFLKEKGSETPISREKTMDLISFDHLQFRLQHGIGYVEGLAVKSSKYWKSNDFVLGVKVIDEQILEKIGTIEEACSGPFRVLHKRSKGNKKHFPPTKGCEIWRLVGVRKNGVYHRILSSEELGIETVGVFLWKYHEMSSPTLEEFLKRSMSKLDEWDDIVKHAKTCVGYDPADYDQTDHNNNNLMGAGLQVNNHQSQIVENNNDNLVGTEQLANANESLGVLNDQNQSVVQVNFDQNLVVANYYQNESFDQDSQVGQNELPRIDSPDQQWFCDNINLDLDSPSNHWATQMILDSPDPYGIDYRVEQSPEL